jgi:ribosomal protein S24E
MELKKQIRNELLKRQEISFIAEAAKNPGFDEMRKKISDELKKPEENIEVYEIQGKFGRNTFLIKANIYDSKEGLDKAIVMKKTQKQKVAEKKAAEDAAKAAAEEAKKKADEERASSASKEAEDSKIAVENAA